MLQLHAYNIHHKNVQTLPKQPEKEKNNFLNPIMQEIFEKYGYLDYNLRCQKNFLLPGVNKTYFGLFARKFGILFLMRLKNSLSLDEFKIMIQQWTPSNCHKL